MAYRLRVRFRVGVRVILLTGLVWIVGCGPGKVTPDIGRIYNRSAQIHDERRNPVVLIPGIFGSRLIDSETGLVVWGTFSGDYAHPQTPEGARAIALPMREGVALRELEDSAKANGSVDRLEVSVLGLPIFLDGYIGILRALGVGGYRSEDLAARGEVDYGSDHYTCFQFDYDWRRSNVENAQNLHEFLLRKRAYVQSELESRFGIVDHDVHFDIVTHSMGALVARYYMRYGDADLPADGSLPKLDWAGAELVDRVVLVGPPNAGAAATILRLVNGKKAGPFLPFYSAAIFGTMPSIYELLPRGRHRALVDADDPSQVITEVFEPELWTRLGWGMSDPKQESMLEWLMPEVEDANQRRRIAIDHQRKCLERAAQFTAALDVPARAPAEVEYYLVTGDAVATDAVVGVDQQSGEVSVIQQQPGDGTVTRSSALMDERLGGEWGPTLVSPISWNQVTFMAGKHLEITYDPFFTDNILYFLLEAPRLRVPSDAMDQ